VHLQGPPRVRELGGHDRRAARRRGGLVRPDPIRAIADAVLYEGYILWPYRRSALKNQRRFTFGGVYPPAHSAGHPDDATTMQTEVLLRAAPDAQLELAVRFLHVIQRDVARRHGKDLEPVDELIVGNERFLSWEEAAEREVRTAPLTLAELQASVRIPIAVPAGSEQEELPGGAGCLLRRWQELRGDVTATARIIDDGVWRLTVVVANTTECPPEITRQEALAHTFCSTHTLLRVFGGGFVSLADPPPELSDAAAGCRNIGTWPVPVGQPGDHGTMLSSPIILEDYPRVAPESPGDLFDGGEIDQLLILNILAMTDEEKAEMAASDARAREILERTESLSPEQLLALHGTVRELEVR
ncbi:MAG: hypothetical protein M3025_03355, partial [Actinomycetota bacterium]|nr:hypothetical protein [Actinomycetota bacterium]